MTRPVVSLINTGADLKTSKCRGNPNTRVQCFASLLFGANPVLIRIEMSSVA